MSKKIALVLSSGGARGVAHIGVIEALEEAGFEITSIAGSSMGAVVGGVYARGKLQEYKKWVCDLDRYDVFKLIDLTLSTQGFVRGERVFNEMKKFIVDCNIEDLPIPFKCVAVDIQNYKEVIFDKGSLYKALRASSSIPSVLKPAIIDGCELVDGGVMNPIPISVIKRQKGDILVVSNVNARLSYTKPKAFKKKEDEVSQDNEYLKKIQEVLKKWNEYMPRLNEKSSKSMSYFDLFNRSINIMQDRIADFILDENPPDVLVKVSREVCSTFEFYKGEELVNAGYKACKKAIKELD